MEEIAVTVVWPSFWMIFCTSAVLFVIGVVGAWLFGALGGECAEWDE